MEHISYQISFQIYDNQEIPFQFEDELLVFFGLNGTSQIFCRNSSYEILPAGLLVINPLELYRLTCLGNASVLCLHLPRALLDLYGWQSTIPCACYARSNQEELPEYRKVREQIALIFQQYFENTDETPVSAGTVRQLLHLLQTDFALDKPVPMQRESTMRRLKRILDIIHERWNEDISLSTIAKQEYLSVSYLSRFFQKNLHMSFSQYVKELRLSHARQMLMRSGMSITRISYDCGFRTPSAFIETFKQQYHQTPGQFRQIQQMAHHRPATTLPQNASQRDMHVLLDYVPEEKAAEIPTRARQIRADCSGSLYIKNTPWRRILNIGYARDGLMAPIQQQIERAQREIGFEFIRFHGILDEDMHIYREDEQGRPEFCFSYVDLLFDFILRLGLKPFVELSFMPSPLAREQTKIFDRPSIISGCIALDKWSELIAALLEHFIQRYGRTNVRNWRFTTISQSYVHLNCVNWDDYQALFKTTWRAIKQVDVELQFGGPGCFAELIGRQEGVPAFFDFAQERGCLPDFVSFQFNP
ncbi:MAG: helix-turn-helix domain-containing protein, partial [Eubacteriales bacterium]|nr:helix-turn-helix domain-containing protein [Eubacteriales bacterium]